MRWNSPRTVAIPLVRNLLIPLFSFISPNTGSMRKRPQMMGSIMLDQLPHIMGCHFSIMDAAFSLLNPEPVFLCPVDDGRQGNLLMIFIL
jgi:hypothetical protein